MKRNEYRDQPGALPLRVKNIGPLKGDRLLGYVPDGLTVLRGGNEAGKTRTLEALLAMPVQKLRPGKFLTEGETEGLISLGPSELALRMTEHGDLSVHRTGEGAIPSPRAMEDPVTTVVTGDGVKDPEAAWKRRVRALLSLWPVPPSGDVLRQIAGLDIDGELGSWLLERHGESPFPDLLLAAEQLRQEIFRRAREKEAEARELERGVDRLGAQTEAHLAEATRAGGFSSSEDAELRAWLSLDPELLHAELVERTARLSRLKESRRHRQALEDRQAEIRESLGERPDGAGETERLEAARVGLSAARSEAERAATTVVRLEKELAAARERGNAARERVTAAEASEDEAREALRAVESAVFRWEEQRSILDRPAEGPEPAEIDEAREHCGRLKRQLDVARVGYRRAQVVQEATELVRQQDEATAEAEALRDGARAVWGRLARVLTEKVGSSVVEVTQSDILLLREDGSKVRLTDEVHTSAGRLRRAVLEFWLERQEASPPGGGSIVVVPEEILLAIGERERERVSSIAAAKGIKLLGEQPDEGDVSLRWYGAEADFQGEAVAV